MNKTRRWKRRRRPRRDRTRERVERRLETERVERREHALERFAESQGVSTKRMRSLWRRVEIGMRLVP